MVKVINLLKDTVNLFPDVYKGQHVIERGGKFYDPGTGKEIPVLSFPPAGRPLAGWPVSVMQREGEIQPFPVQLGGRTVHIPLWEARMELIPILWRMDPGAAYGLDDGEEALFIVPTAVLVAAETMGIPHPFIAPLSGPWRVSNQNGETVGTVGFVRRIRFQTPDGR